MTIISVNKNFVPRYTGGTKPQSLDRLLNKSIATSTVPKQWKLASITPSPKTAAPQEHADYRAISILSGALERVIVRESSISRTVYPAELY